MILTVLIVSSLRTESEIDRANENRLSEQRLALEGRPIGRPFTRGRVPTPQRVTEAQRAAGSVAGSASQRKKSFNRVNPFTRFCTYLRMVWRHSSGIEKEVLLERRFECYTVVNLVSELNSCYEVNLPRERFNVFSQILRGETRTRSGWSIKYLTLPSFPISAFDIKAGSTLFDYIYSKKSNSNNNNYNSLFNDFLNEFSSSYSNEFLVKFFESTIKF